MSEKSVQQISQVDLNILLDTVKNEVKRELNCVSIGTIVSFDTLTQTASISLNYKRVLKQRNSDGPNSFTDVTIPYPQLVRVPIVVLSGGGASVTLPVNVGDNCLILFCDRDIDSWLEFGNTGSPPNSERLHDLSDGVAIVGLFPANKGLKNYLGGMVNIDCWWAQTTGNFTAGNGADGVFATGDGRTVTVSGGIIVSIG